MIAAIILAAGESLRMGTAKALLPFSKNNGCQTTFLQNLIDVFTHSRAEPILVVLGSNVEIIRSQTKFGNARSIINKNYKDGMLSSIQAGLKALANDIQRTLIQPLEEIRVIAEEIGTPCPEIRGSGDVFPTAVPSYRISLFNLPQLRP